MPVNVPWRNQGRVKEIKHRMCVGFMKGGHWVTFEKRLGENKAIKVLRKVCSRQRGWHMWPEDHIG